MERVPVGIPERRAEVNAKERSDVRITGFASLRRASPACQLLADVRWMNEIVPLFAKPWGRVTVASSISAR
jgi:hypothetical protein